MLNTRCWPFSEVQIAERECPLLLHLRPSQIICVGPELAGIGPTRLFQGDNCLYFRVRLPVQPIDATHALNRSAGVSNPSVLRGRSFN